MQSKVLFCTLALIATSLVGQSQAGTIADSLKSKVASQGKSDAILELPSTMSSVLSNPALAGLSGDERTNMFADLMQQTTSASQAPFLSSLSLMGADATPFWVSNKVAIKDANPAVLSMLSMMPGSFTVREPQKVKLSVPFQNRTVRGANDKVQWGVEKIGAPSVWASGCTGKGVIVAAIDTGVNGEHESLKSNYAGAFYNGITRRSSKPVDDQGHGTHVMGTICGTTKGIGVAKGATWIACKALDRNGGGSEQSLIKCAQWMIKPNGKANLKPCVVSNSWGGGQNNGFFDQEIASWQANGIIPVFAIGNSGQQGCQSANSPGDRPDVISVGSTMRDDGMSYFSSRGFARDSTTLKPEVSAPGHDIYSARHDQNRGYTTMSGTSMACPHTAGAVALLKSGGIAKTYQEVLDKLESTANKEHELEDKDVECGKPENQEGPYPNNAYGYGRIDVKNAFGL